MKTDELEDKETIPFFIIVITVMVFMYAMTLYLTPWLRKPPALIYFTAGMALHTILHWMYRKFSRERRQAVVYFCFQSLLAGVLIIYAGEISLVFGLYMALLGEEVGLFRSIRSIIISVTVNVLLIVLTLLFIQRSSGFNGFFYIGLIPMILFVIIYVNLYSRQLEARIKAQNLLSELEQTNIKLSLSNARVEELTRDKERQRIARELHDTLAQGLSGIILQLEAVNAYMDEQKTERAREIINKSMMKARETLADARRVIDDLREPRSGEIVFEEFLHSEAEAAGARGGFCVDTDIDSAVLIPPDVKMHLQKIAAEGLGNCAEHSGAANVKLSLSLSGGRLALVISDDGIGFNPTAVEAGHYGLVGIKERCALLGGRLSIDSSPGHGTRLTVVIPGELNGRQ
ncbi:MAG: sensor histidine kinase [Spirochaetales bacterium]|nr:sensor histidine kinase [Spirochaetales bacterium]